MKSLLSVHTHIAAKLKLARLNLGMSQETLGASICRTFQQIQKYERAANRISAGTLWEFSKTLQVPITYFYDGLDDKSESTPIHAPSKEAVRLLKAFEKLSPSRRKALLAIVEEML